MHIDWCPIRTKPTRQVFSKRTCGSNHELGTSLKICLSTLNKMLMWQGHFVNGAM